MVPNAQKRNNVSAQSSVLDAYGARRRHDVDFHKHTCHLLHTKQPDAYPELPRGKLPPIQGALQLAWAVAQH